MDGYPETILTDTKESTQCSDVTKQQSNTIIKNKSIFDTQDIVEVQNKELNRIIFNNKYDKATKKGFKMVYIKIKMPIYHLDYEQYVYFSIRYDGKFTEAVVIKKCDLKLIPKNSKKNPLIVKVPNKKVGMTVDKQARNIKKFYKRYKLYVKVTN